MPRGQEKKAPTEPAGSVGVVCLSRLRRIQILMIEFISTSYAQRRSG